MCVEWNCHYFFSFSFVVFLLVPVLFACATILYHHIKDKYNIKPTIIL